MDSAMDLNVINPAMDMKDLTGRLLGTLLMPGNPEYEQARKLWNGTIDRRPAAILRSKSPQDVMAGVRFARHANLPVAVRSGGHSTVGKSMLAGGLVIDLSRMKGMVVDSYRGLARVDAGLTFGELARGLEPYGLMVNTGTCAGTGVAGAVLGAGLGWLAGKYGLSIDDVLGLEMVTSDGELVRANALENPDLYWGLRGGGGNFGIVTSFELRVHPQGLVLAGPLAYPLSQASQILAFYQDTFQSLPDELALFAVVSTLPEIGPVFMLLPCWSGDLEEGEEVIAGLRRAARPVMDGVRPMKYSELLAMMDPIAPDGRNYYDRAYTLRAFSPDAIEALLESAAEAPQPFSSIVIHEVHGAAVRHATDETAFPMRFPHFSILHSGAWEQGEAQPHRAWVDRSVERMQPYAEPGVYINFLGEEGDAEVRRSYGANYARLAALKAQYDPDNFFRSNQNILPQAAGRQ